MGKLTGTLAPRVSLPYMRVRCKKCHMRRVPLGGTFVRGLESIKGKEPWLNRQFATLSTEHPTSHNRNNHAMDLMQVSQNRASNLSKAAFEGFSCPPPRQTGPIDHPSSGIRERSIRLHWALANTYDFAQRVARGELGSRRKFLQLQRRILSRQMSI